MTVYADTSFLIDLQRAERNPRHQAARRWLAANPEVEIGIPVVVLGEFAEGFEDTVHPVIEHYRAAHRSVEIDAVVAMSYSRISRELRAGGKSIGANDTWIAATALAHRVALLTRNGEHFRQVAGLALVEYGEESL